MTALPVRRPAPTEGAGLLLLPSLLLGLGCPEPADDDAADDDSLDDDDASQGPPRWDWSPPLGLIPPVFVALQDGEGAWSALNAADGTVDLAVADPAGRYTALLVCTSGGVTSVLVVAASTVELPHLLSSCPAADNAAATAHLSGNLGGLGADQFGEVRAGYADAHLQWFENAYDLAVPPATWDVVASRALSYGGPPERLLVERDLAIPAEGLARSLDVQVSGVPTVSRSAGVAGAVPESPRIRVDWLTAGGTFFPLGVAPSAAELDYGEPADSLWREDDAILVSAGGGGAGQGETRWSSWSFHPPGEDLSIAIPEELAGATAVAHPGSSGAHWDLVWQAHAGAIAWRATATAWTFDFSTGWSWTMLVTAGRAGAEPAWSSPDPATVPGFDAAWGIDASWGAPLDASAVTRVVTDGAVAPDDLTTAIWLASSAAITPATMPGALRPHLEASGTDLLGAGLAVATRALGPPPVED
jgi:hypothetical protein